MNVGQCKVHSIKTEYIFSYRIRHIPEIFRKIYNCLAFCGAPDHICHKSNGICFVDYLFQCNPQIRMSTNIQHYYYFI